MEKRDKHLSKMERKRFDVIAESMTVREAAVKLGICPSTLYNWVYKIRKKIKRERGHVNAVLAQTRRCKLLKDVLSEKRPPQGFDDEEEEDEDFE